MKEQIYYIKGMHCASCEVIIEKQLLAIDGVEFADASLSTGKVVVGYRNGKPHIEHLNRLFKELGYAFSEKPFAPDEGFWTSLVGPAMAAGVIIFLFLSLDNLGLTSLITVNSSSPLGAFFVFGLIAGLSTCAALVGGLILSLSKQWNERYAHGNSIIERAEPHFMFNVGRIISYGIFGAVLGLIGKKLQITQDFTSILVLIVSAIMLALAMQMLGVKAFSKFQIALPKSITHRIADESKPEGKYTPFITGALTFFLPCGFTIISQGVAILSGSAVKGGLIMAFFALGTMLPLLFIGITSTKMLNTNLAEKFLKTAGILILFFVVYNLNVQFGLSRYLTDNASSTTTTQTATVATSNGDEQVIKTVYTSENDIVPSSFEVKKGTPVRFEVDVQDNGSGCMSTIMVPGLYDDPQYLSAGETLIMEFTPTKTGTYQITCAMGVPRGTIIVTE